MFSIEKNGYSKNDVNNAITILKTEIAKLSKTCKEKEVINIKLASAVDKAKQIQYSSKNLSDLKLQKYMVLYKGFEKDLNNLLSFSQFDNVNLIKNLFNKFTQNIKSVLFDDSTSSINDLVHTENDSIRLLLNKMSNYAKIYNENNDIKIDKIKRKEKDSIENYENERRISERPSQIKPISNIKIENNENYETIADKFLESNEETQTSVYAKKLAKTKRDNYPAPNESGFNLREAVNPTEDLNTIMKSFDFN
ncbi:MAG: hypothetical protein PHX09_01850 [Clostridia bacterium]|nr:hypothetical protein [Clostridia bacterium]